MLLAGAVSDQRGQFGQQGVERELAGDEAELAGLDAREVEDVVDDAEQQARGGAQLGQVTALALAQRGLVEQGGHAEDRVHRRADLVAHVGQELALGTIRRFGRIARHAQLGFECALGGDVAGEAVEAGQLAVHITDRDLGALDAPDVAVAVAQLELEEFEGLIARTVRTRDRSGVDRIIGQHLAPMRDELARIDADDALHRIADRDDLALGIARVDEMAVEAVDQVRELALVRGQGALGGEARVLLALQLREQVRQRAAEQGQQGGDEHALAIELSAHVGAEGIEEAAADRELGGADECRARWIVELDVGRETARLVLAGPAIEAAGRCVELAVVQRQRDRIEIGVAAFRVAQQQQSIDDFIEAPGALIRRRRQRLGDARGLRLGHDLGLRGCFAIEARLQQRAPVHGQRAFEDQGQQREGQQHEDGRSCPHGQTRE